MVLDPSPPPLVDIVCLRTHLYIRMYMYKCICKCIYAAQQHAQWRRHPRHLYIYSAQSVYAYIFMYTYINIYISACICVRVFVYMQRNSMPNDNVTQCTYKYTVYIVYIFMYTYICKYMCMRTCLCIHAAQQHAQW